MTRKLRNNDSDQNSKPSYKYFRLTPLAAFVTSASLLLSATSYAQDNRSAAEIQAEVSRLKQQLEKEEQALASKAAENPQAAANAKSSEKVEADQPTQLGKVVVRARNRIERLQDVPLSVSVVTGQELERLQAQDLGAITKRASNVSWNQGNQRTSSVSIRGVGKIGQTEAQDPSVGIIVDGVNYAYNPLSSSFDFTDVEAVEVTRGPQGTLQGKNASLGVINILTRKPSFTPSADYAVSYGVDDTLRARVAGGGPIVDDLLAWRAAVSVSKGQGDYKNQYNPDSTYQNTDRVSGRVQFLLTPSDDFSARIALDAQPRSGENTNGLSFKTPTPTIYSDGLQNHLTTDASTRLARSWFTQRSGYTYADYLDTKVNNDSQQPVTTGSHGASAELNKTLGDFNLTSITAWKDYHFDAHNNDEGTPFDIQSSSGQQIDYRQASQEFRLSSQIENLVDYQTGVFLMKTSTNIRRNVIYGGDAGAWFASTPQYNTLVTNAGTNVAAGKLLLQDSLNGVWKNENRQAIDNKSEAIFGQANWHISNPLTLTTGLRFTWEQRQNPGSSQIYNNGNGALLNDSGQSATGVALGGFDVNANGTLKTPGDAAQVALADQLALKYFGVATYNALSAQQKSQVAAAKAIRRSQIGVLWNPSDAEKYNGVLPAWVISPSYKINENLTTYASWQYGEKAGISQQVNGTSALAKAEKSNSFELGLKTLTLNNTLVLNADVFITDIKDYQQAIQVFDPYTTANKADGKQYYSSITGNVPKVQVKGIEFDGVYAGIPHTTLRFSGAYNNAVYKDFKTSAQPAEYDAETVNYPNANGTAPQPYRDVTGKTLPGAPKYQFNIGADYRIPVSLGVFGQKEFHTSTNWAFTSYYNSDPALSDYAVIPSNSLFDFGMGLSTLDRKFDVNLIVKNLFDNDVPLAKTWNTYTPATPRWYGIEFSGKL